MTPRSQILSLLTAAVLAVSVSACCSCPGKAGARGNTPCGGMKGSAAATSANAEVVGGTRAKAVEGAPDGWVAAPGVVVSAQPAEAAWAAYSAAGYRTVVNFRPDAEGADRERDLVAANGMQYFHVPVVGANVEWGDADALAKILADGHNHKILLHCSSGNRAAGTWALYQNRHRGLAPQAAIDEARRVAPLEKQAVERLEVLMGLREEPCPGRKMR